MNLQWPGVFKRVCLQTITDSGNKVPKTPGGPSFQSLGRSTLVIFSTARERPITPLRFWGDSPPGCEGSAPGVHSLTIHFEYLHEGQPCGKYT